MRECQFLSKENDFSFEQYVQVESLIGNWKNGTTVYRAREGKVWSNLFRDGGFSLENE